MFLRIEKGSSVPISRQIADEIRALCLTARLKPRQQLPSVRELARELAINQNTVLRVYERLSGEGFLEMRHGEGTFVGERLPLEQLDAQRAQFATELEQLVRRGRLLAIESDEMQALVRQAAENHDAAEPVAGVSPETTT